MSSDTNVAGRLATLHSQGMTKGKEKTGLGKRIAAAREKAGLSQTELGKAFGLTRSAVSQWESEGTEPTPANLRAIAMRCDVDYDWLATARGHMTNTDDPDLAELIQLAREADRNSRADILAFLRARKTLTSPEPDASSQGQPPSTRK
jgi:transcriptional regulator with XRE-family HTH domain